MSRTLLELDLTRGVTDPPPASPVAMLRARGVPSLRHLLGTLRRARDDDRVAGLVAHLGGTGLSLAQTQDLRDAVTAFRASGKHAVIWSESYGELGPGTVPYYLATAFDEVWVQPSGELGVTGVAVEAVFLRDALDKVGVVPQVGKRKEYKTAADTFTEREMTEPAREMAARLAASAYEQIVAGVAAARKLPEERVRELVDTAPFSAAQALEAGLVDRLGYRTDVYDALKERLGATEPKLVERYSRRRPRDLADLVPQRTKPAVAVVSVNGGIALGRSGGRGGPGGGPGAGSDTVGAALRAAARDEHVQAVVLRVDSPGGSYVASDAIRDEVLRLRGTGRPVIASMGTVAASGGYYVSMPADVIVAQPGTITGSIGVVGGKGVLRDAFGKVGIARQGVAEGRNARMFSTHEEFSPEQWERIEEMLDRIYADFVGKAAQDRGLGFEQVEQIARGRVWTGSDARERGLVDELGGLDRAIDLACARVGAARDDVAVRALPHRSIVDRLKPAESTDDVAVRTSLSDGLTATVYAALGLPPTGVLSMPVAWRFS
jgi:protease IV